LISASLNVDSGSIEVDKNFVGKFFWMDIDKVTTKTFTEFDRFDAKQEKIKKKAKSKK
jgi:hypothetical protein